MVPSSVVLCQTRPPTRSRASRTTTDLRASLISNRAAASPANPAPTTQTSAWRWSMAIFLSIAFCAVTCGDSTAVAEHPDFSEIDRVCLTAKYKRFADRIAVTVEKADGHRERVEFDRGEAELARRFGRVERVLVRDERRDGIGAGAADEKPRIGVDQLQVMIVAADVEIHLSAAHQRIEFDHAQVLVAREVAVVAGGDDRMMAGGDPPWRRLFR